MNELFAPDSVSMNSPRLVWLKQHDIHTYKSPCVEEDDEPWSCWAGSFESVSKLSDYETGQTEDEAITKWAVRHGVRLWNEQ